MTIVIDSHIPFLLEAVQQNWPQVEICPMNPEQIDASAVRDADVLIVRTRAQVNESLLHDSSVRLVCTATIGFDHIDTAYCASRGIRWMSCPGCNAQAVCDYIEEALNETISNLKFQISNSPTIGVVGNDDYNLVNKGKAGKTRWAGTRPTVRGSVMNPNDHPHGGGEGKSPVGRDAPRTPWGKRALGVKTRNKKKASNKLMIRRINDAK